MQSFGWPPKPELWKSWMQTGMYWTRYYRQWSMLNNTTGFKRINIACGWTELRLGINGLCAIIRCQLDIDPFQKNVLFMFCGRKPDKIKCLIWKGDGFLLYKCFLDGSTNGPDKAGGKGNDLGTVWMAHVRTEDSPPLSEKTRKNYKQMQ